MIKLTFFIFLLIFIKFSFQIKTLEQVNEDFQQRNKILVKSLDEIVEEIGNYTKKLNSTVGNLPNIENLIFRFPESAETFKSLKFKFFEEIKSCHHLKFHESQKFIPKIKLKVFESKVHSERSLLNEVCLEILKICNKTENSEKCAKDYENFSSKVR